MMITYGFDERRSIRVAALALPEHQHQIRDIATGITDRTSDPGIAGLTTDEEITEFLADLNDHDQAIPTPSEISQTDIEVHDQRLSA